jgi:hypothetical protein
VVYLFDFFLSPFRISSKILFKEHMYKGIPIARKTYSFLTIVMSAKIMYKLGRISSNDAQTPTYGFVIIFWQTVINLNMGWLLFDSVMMMYLLLFCTSNVLYNPLFAVSIVIKPDFIVMKF